MSKVKVGILGGGGILDAHAPAFAANMDVCEVVAVAERSQDEQTIARIHRLLGPDVTIYRDYRELLEKADVEAVDIVLPHDLHMPATIAAAEAGKHVLTEKVMARNIYECDRMIETCSKANVTLTVCHDRRYSEEWGAIKGIIASGRLGELFYFKLEHNQNVIFPENAWVRYRDGIGGGAIMSCLTHQIDALRWFGGEVDSVNCMSKVMPERMQGECIGVVLARMASGAIAQLSINWWTTSHRSQNGLWYELIHVCGKEGEVYYMTGKGTYLKIYDASDRSLFEYSLGQTDKGFEKVEVTDPRPGHERCITEWLKLVRGEEAHILTPGTDSRLTVEVAEAAYRAEENGQTVKLPIEPRPWVSFN